jgi:hypothetical protein
MALAQPMTFVRTLAELSRVNVDAAVARGKPQGTDSGRHAGAARFRPHRRRLPAFVGEAGIGERIQELAAGLSVGAEATGPAEHISPRCSIPDRFPLIFVPRSPVRTELSEDVAVAVRFFATAEDPPEGTGAGLPRCIARGSGFHWCCMGATAPWKG